MAESRMDTLSEREPVRFDIPAEGLSDAELRLVQHIKEVAEETLYHWRTFPIVLPAPVAVQNSDVSSSSLARRKPIVVRDLFVAPCFDELEAVALDSGGEPRKLSSQQLSSVRESGEFEVESVNFPGQVHRWRLSELLQKGTERSYQSYLDDLALSLRFLIVTARGRISSHFFSLRQSLRSLLRGLVLLVDVFAGFPSLQSCDLDSKLMEERARYLVAELVCKPDQEEELDELCHYVRRQLARLQVEKSEPGEADRPPLLYTFHTPHGLAVDLRLFDRDLMKRATPVLAGVLESEARGWFAPFRERAITELQSQGLDDEQIRRSACAAVQEEYLRRVLAAVRASPPLEELGEGVCRLLAENAQSVVLMQRAVENVSQKLASFQKSLRHFIDTHHPVRSRIDAWVRHKFRAAESRFALEHQWAAHEEALALCKENGLQQTAYFLQRDLTFMREREPVLQKELQRVKTPTREFEWRAHIWLWSNWTVYRRFQGDSKAIPTVISQTSTSITNPRNNPSEPVFVLEKEVVRTTTTRWLFWRWCNFVHRLWSWGSNGFYLLGVVIPWSSPVSLRALLCVEPFTPDLELSQVNGTLCPRRSSLTPTLTSRLVSLWRHISKSRTEFETRPDTGFIGKEMTRHLNRVWNYALKGAVGTLLLVTLFPAVCLVTSLVSLLLAAAVPLWAPAAVLLFHLFLVLCYDFDSPSPERNRWCVLLEALVWHVGVLGVLQPLAALLVAGVVCPLLALAVLVYGWLRWCCRRLWDRVAYDAVVSRKGRIPCSDSMLVTRVHGPGLSSDYYLQIRAEQALAAFEARLEADELAAFARQTARRIEQPQTACAAFVSRVLSPFSAQLSGTGVYGKLCEEAKQLNSTLQERIEKRQYDLQTALTPAQRRKVKLTPRDLQLTLVAGARMLEDFYPSHVLARLSAAAEGAGDVTDDVTGDAAAFWEGRGLAVGDWAGLSAQVLTEVFSADVLTPLHHTDTHFYLEVHRVSLHRYTELLRRAAAVPVPVPLVQTAAHIQVAAPALELAVFSPSAGRGRDRSASGHRSASRRLRPWKRQRTSAIYTAEKLAARLPLPHPLRVALTVYNREADSPVCAEDDPACRRLLAALESVTTAHAQIEGDGAVLSESLERESEEGRESVGHVEVSVDEGGGGDSASVDDSRREYTIDSTSGYRIDDDVVQIAHNPIAGTSQPSRWTSIPLGSSIVTPPAGAGAGTGHSRDPSLASIDFITVRLSELAMMDSGEDHGDLRSQSLRTTDV